VLNRFFSLDRLNPRSKCFLLKLLRMISLAPEEIELKKKRSVLERLKDRLATHEEEMADLRAELEQFEARYTMEVGRLYADLDEIDAEIAEEEVKLNPEDEEIKRKAEDARKRAEESAAQADEENWQACTFKWQPTAEAKKAYHKLARLIHPDLALDAEEREKRHGLMARLNDAYSAGDQNLLNKLVEEYRDSPDLIKGDSVGDELVRAIRQIAQVKARLRELREEKLALGLSELFVLSEKVHAEMIEGRNLLKQIAERTRTHIKKAERRLSNLRQANLSESSDKDVRYGFNISSFQ
jgi:DnaJ-class molecular chaperone with C-terminal Zn finger domain